MTNEERKIELATWLARRHQRAVGAALDAIEALSALPDLAFAADALRVNLPAIRAAGLTAALAAGWSEQDIFLSGFRPEVA